MKTGSSVIFYSVITIFLWGLWGFFGKLAINRKMPPVSIFLAEVVICLLCGVVVLLLVLHGQDHVPWRESWNIFGFLSGTCLASGLIFYYFALQNGHATVVVPLTALYPAVTVVLSYAILRERPSSIQWIGFLLVIAGAFLLLSSPMEGEVQN